MTPHNTAGCHASFIQIAVEWQLYINSTAFLLQCLPAAMRMSIKRSPLTRLPDVTWEVSDWQQSVVHPTYDVTGAQRLYDVCMHLEVLSQQDVVFKNRACSSSSDRGGGSSKHGVPSECRASCRHCWLPCTRQQHVHKLCCHQLTGGAGAALYRAAAHVLRGIAHVLLCCCCMLCRPSRSAVPW
jgi:hypothetical protein